MNFYNGLKVIEFWISELLDIELSSVEIIFEFIFQFILEILGQLFFEIIVELCIGGFGHSVSMNQSKSPILSCLGYVLLGSLGAGLSLLVLPSHFIENYHLRILNLFLAPIIVGLIMSLRGRRLVKKGKDPIRIDSFAYGFLFAFVFGLVRFCFGK